MRTSSAAAAGLLVVALAWPAGGASAQVKADLDQLRGNLVEALRDSREQLVMTRAAGDARETARTHLNLGDDLADLGLNADALAHYDTALAGARTVRDPWIAVRALVGKGVVRQRSGHVDSASVLFARAAVRLDSLRRGAQRDRFQVAASEMLADLFGHWSLALLAREPTTGSDRAALAALAAADLGRAQALQEHLVEGSDKAGSIAASMPEVPPDPARVEDIETTLVAAGRDLVRGAGAPFVYYQLAADTLLIWTSSGPEDIHLKRQPLTRQATVEWGRANNAPPYFERELLPSSARDSLANLILELRFAMQTGYVGLRSGGDLETSDPPPADAADGDRAMASAAILSNILIPADIVAHGAGGELLIVPHAFIAAVPYAMLPVLSDGKPGDLLGDLLALRYAPSLALAVSRPVATDPAHRGAADQQTGEWRYPAPGSIVVGNPDMPFVGPGSSRRLGPLEDAELEAGWVAERLGVDTLTGAEASEVAIRRMLARAPIVHLATHGLAYSSERRARDSYIALAPDTTAEGSAADGRFTVAEILEEAPSVVADLVVLSACQTGLGDLTESEGTVGLQRAFLAKGARSLLVSLWDVDDVATRYLMEQFYTHWLGRGAPKSIALQRAMRDVRARPGWSEPRYWAGFQLVGER